MRRDDLLEIKRRHREEQHKYAYFLLAISAGSIAFTVKITSGMILSWPMIFLAMAIIFWGLSFFFGCRNRLYSTMTLYASAGIIQLEEGFHPDQPQDPDTLKSAIETVRRAEVLNAEKTGFYGRWQLRLLVWGGVTFLIWHILELIKRTIAI